MIWANEMALVEKNAIEDTVTMAKSRLMNTDDDDELAVGFGMRLALVMLNLWPEGEKKN